MNSNMDSRSMKPQSRERGRSMRIFGKGLLKGLALVLAIAPMSAAFAATSVTGIQHASMEDGSVRISMQTSGDVPQVSVFATESPARIVLDESLVTTPKAKAFQDADSVPFVIFTREDAPEIGIRELEEAGAVVHPVRGYHEGLDLQAVMDVCWGTGIRSILCEGGGVLASALIDQELADRIYLFLAPRTLGSGGVPAFPGPFRPQAWDGWIPTLPGKKMRRDVMIVLDREA